ncbi:alkane 1-monooxygenase [Pseudomonas sp. Ost2]|uniref:LLM class flavin-dependent oxidoreductase n=1 Tax=Pseudomonas sp. Ost2 TaxID=2678260 RepID=UPI001BB35F3A|nr:LLM class flavin-dependent oxidoreductase [Pseudomonas sp. Ost2]BBP74716.1 alkane 1-monooxygenase [Pseudomonas sp. Ost2]
MTVLSVLDVAHVAQGSDPGQALRHSLDVARHAERLGYRRFWLAEHHNMPGIASAATSVAIGYVAAGTSTIRVGAGGIMLPNHPPLAIAEQFGTLESLYPGRIDLGVGRAPGADQITARAMRRNPNGDEDRFPLDVAELIDLFQPAIEGQAVQAVPGAGLEVPIWMLGSSIFGAHLAAYLGLPFAFAAHIGPQALEAALSVYREHFRPSERLSEPYVMVSLNVIAGESDEEARFLASSMQQAFINQRMGRPGYLPAPIDGYLENLDSNSHLLLKDYLSLAVIGGARTVPGHLKDFAAIHGIDELILVSQIFEHPKRLRSLEIAADKTIGI